MGDRGRPAAGDRRWRRRRPTTRRWNPPREPVQVARGIDRTSCSRPRDGCRSRRPRGGLDRGGPDREQLAHHGRDARRSGTTLTVGHRPERAPPTAKEKERRWSSTWNTRMNPGTVSMTVGSASWCFATECVKTGDELVVMVDALLRVSTATRGGATALPWPRWCETERRVRQSRRPAGPGAARRLGRCYWHAHPHQ